jgi:hypothetical protein
VCTYALILKSGRGLLPKAACGGGKESQTEQRHCRMNKNYKNSQKIKKGDAESSMQKIIAISEL